MKLSPTEIFESIKIFFVGGTRFVGKVTFSMLLLLLICLFFNNYAFAQVPKVPYKDVGACPFECCIYRQWTAKKETILYKQMSEKSPIAFRVKRREKVTGVTGVVITNKAGTVKVLNDYTAKELSTDYTKAENEISIKSGEVFYVLTSVGEGFYQLWYKGKFFQDEIYNEENMKVLTEPEADWWVKIKNRKGQIGWTKLPENFDNKDGCG